MTKKIDPKEFFNGLKSHPSKTLGQNFIKDLRVIDRIIDVSGLNPEDEVVEIGPGLGALTSALLKRSSRVVAIEKDKRLADFLNDLFSDNSKIEIINQDALEIDYGKIYKGKKIKVIANLPYSVSTPLLFTLLEAREFIHSMVLMLQLEVGQRISAVPGGKIYGSISVLLQTFMDITSEFRVSPESFWPRPKVDSVVLKLVPLGTPRTNVPDEKLYERIVRAAFSSRRKMLGNSLQSVLSKELAKKALELSNIDSKKRAETLTIEEFGLLVEKVTVLEKGM